MLGREGRRMHQFDPPLPWTVFVANHACMSNLHDAAEGQVADRRERGDVHLRDELVGRRQAI